jgi:hypothetical protein
MGRTRSDEQVHLCSEFVHVTLLAVLDSTKAKYWQQSIPQVEAWLFQHAYEHVHMFICECFVNKTQC